MLRVRVPVGTDSTHRKAAVPEKHKKVMAGQSSGHDRACLKLERLARRLPLRLAELRIDDRAHVLDDVVRDDRVAFGGRVERAAGESRLGGLHAGGKTKR